MKDLKILVADDHPLLLKGFIMELEHRGYTNMLPANDGLEALTFITENKPDIAILDIEMPKFSGFQVIKKATEAKVATKFIIFTSHKEKGFVLKAKQLNINGYVLKDESFSEIENCINAVAKGGNYFSASFQQIFDSKVSPNLQMLKFLSNSELKILKEIAIGFSSAEISEKLSISIRTVEKHRANIASKFDLQKKQDALATWVTENKSIILEQE